MDQHGRVWFVGQVGNYVANLDPKTGEFKRFELEAGTNPHNLVVDAKGMVWFTGNANGRILKLFESRAGGHMIYAADSSERFILMYAHLDAYQPGLMEGQRITQGQQIGVVGTTGNADANVPHLHFAIAGSSDVRIGWKGAPVNPYPLLTP